MSDSPVIVWFRKDLRLVDHAALHAAAETGQPVVTVFVLDERPTDQWGPGGASRWWLHHSLASLSASLSAVGGSLTLRRGDSLSVIPGLVRDTGATAVYAGGLGDPWARQRDKAVSAALDKQGAKLHRLRTTTLFNPDAIRTKAGGPFGVYTPFAKACLLAGGPREPLPAPERLRGPPGIDSDSLESWGLLPTRPDWAGGLRETWTPGEQGAAERAGRFLDNALAGYDAARNLPGEDGTSMLSPHLHFGEISPERLWHLAHRRPGGKGRETFIKELLWREFCANLLWHNPDLPDAPLRPEFAAMPWRDDPAGLRAWQHGRTGVPIVDAGMRQLWHTGWMHNRVRMIVASFLIKHMMIPWQAGEAWFWDTLVDADLASNAANWQWVAGCGADAAPYFRVFNPVLQGRKFDPDGTYIRRFVPELANFPAAHIHAPWEAPPELARRAGYPPPVVGIAEGRARALDAYERIRAAG